LETVVIRPAMPVDYEALAQLYREFHEFHVRGVPTRLCHLGNLSPTERHRLYDRFTQITAGPDSNLFVARTRNGIAGLAEVYVREDDPQPGVIPHRYGYLQSLMVAEAYRRGGIGALLLETAENWAREKGADEMQLDTWEFADGPLPFYEKNDYRALKRKLAKRL
jgi:GNAT superfamily N-acetyltransferase